MQRYFCEQINNDTFTLSKDDSYHIEKVMRMKKEEKIEVVYNKETYICKINGFNPVNCEIIEKLNENINDNHTQNENETKGDTYE